MYTVEVQYYIENWYQIQHLEGVYSTPEGAQNKASVLKGENTQQVADSSDSWEKIVIKLWDGDQSQVVSELTLCESD